MIIDKCFKNEIDDVKLINFPIDLKPKQALDLSIEKSISMESPLTKAEDLRPKDKDCSTFIYAAYLSPGSHQFLIYCPITNRVFVKDFVVVWTKIMNADRQELKKLH